MKEIKVRAWHNDSKQMYPVSCLGFEKDQLIEIAVDCGRSATPKEICYGATDEYPLDVLVLMESTGLKDKHGQEIFEGDIVAVPNYTYEPSGVDGPSVLLSVHYERGCFFTDRGLLGNERGVWVVGNVFENPNLLEACE